MDAIEKVMREGALHALEQKIDAILWSIKLSAERSYKSGTTIKWPTLQEELRRIHALATEAETFVDAYEKADTTPSPTSKAAGE